MNHNDLRTETLLAANKISGVKLWPNPVGLATAGKVVKRFVKNGKSYVLIENPRPMKFGTCKGASDCIGFQTVRIGSIEIPRFLGVEIKVGKDSLKPEQRNFKDMVNIAGGTAGVVRDSVDGLKNILGMPLKRVRD